MRNARVNGVDLEYDEAGTGEAVLMISPVLADGFRPLVSERELADRYRLISYHKRGWGGSTHTSGPVSIGDHAADAAALLDHLGVRRAHVVGHSSGAAVAAELALGCPEIVHTLSLLELSLLSVPGAGAFFEKVKPAFESYAAREPETAFATFMSVVSGLDWKACRAVLDQSIPGSVTHAIEDARTFFEVELPALQTWTFGAQQAAAIGQPVLSVLGSDTEPLWIEIAGCLRSWLPQVEECTIAGVGHLLHIQSSEPVAHAVAEFFGRHPIAPDDVQRNPSRLSVNGPRLGSRV